MSSPYKGVGDESLRGGERSFHFTVATCQLIYHILPDLIFAYGRIHKLLLRSVAAAKFRPAVRPTHSLVRARRACGLSVCGRRDQTQIQRATCRVPDGVIP